MTYCSKCGKQNPDGAKSCSGCGGAVRAGEEQSARKNNAPPQGAAEYDPAKDAAEHKGISVVAYLLFFIPLIMGAHKTSEFVKFHTNQGLVLFIFYAAWGIIHAILSAILSAVLFSGSFAVWSIISLILGLIWIIPAIFLVIGILNVVRGVCKPLPLIGKIRIIK